MSFSACLTRRKLSLLAVAVCLLAGCLLIGLPTALATDNPAIFP